MFQGTFAGHEANDNHESNSIDGCTDGQETET